LEVLRDFYRQHIVAQTLGFLDAYIVLTINEIELRQRKENDLTRKISGFAKNLQIIEPQQRYFQAMNNIAPGFVHLIQATSVEQNLKNIIKTLPSFSKLPEHRYSLTLFDFLIEWLYTNKPDD
jgi:hypothetical protein